MARYGVPYKGSKNAIAEWVVNILPAGNRLVDLFAGGCAVTHCAMLSGKWNNYMANDIGTAHVLFYDAIHGKYHNEKRWISREAFFMLKETDPYIKWVWSFGNDGDSYMYSRELEPYKKAVHKSIFGETVHERYIGHREAIRILQSLQSLQSLESLERLERLERLQSLEIQTNDYRDVQLHDGDVVYCDIPYKGTGAEYCKGFDHDAFYDWCLNCPYPVYISEYSMPEDRFECIAEKQRRDHLSSTDNTQIRIERIYTFRR